MSAGKDYTKRQTRNKFNQPYQQQSPKITGAPLDSSLIKLSADGTQGELPNGSIIPIAIFGSPDSTDSAVIINSSASGTGSAAVVTHEDIPQIQIDAIGLAFILLSSGGTYYVRTISDPTLFTLSTAYVFSGATINSVQFSPDGNHILVGAYKLSNSNHTMTLYWYLLKNFSLDSNTHTVTYTFQNGSHVINDIDLTLATTPSKPSVPPDMVSTWEQTFTISHYFNDFANVPGAIFALKAGNYRPGADPLRYTGNGGGLITRTMVFEEETDADLLTVQSRLDAASGTINPGIWIFSVDSDKNPVIDFISSFNSTSYSTLLFRLQKDDVQTDINLTKGHTEVGGFSSSQESSNIIFSCHKVTNYEYGNLQNLTECTDGDGLHLVPSICNGFTGPGCTNGVQRRIRTFEMIYSDSISVSMSRNVSGITTQGVFPSRCFDTFLDHLPQDTCSGISISDNQIIPSTQCQGLLGFENTLYTNLHPSIAPSNWVLALEINTDAPLLSSSGNRNYSHTTTGSVSPADSSTSFLWLATLQNKREQSAIFALEHLNTSPILTQQIVHTSLTTQEGIVNEVSSSDGEHDADASIDNNYVDAHYLVTTTGTVEFDSNFKSFILGFKSKTGNSAAVAYNQTDHIIYLHPYLNITVNPEPSPPISFTDLYYVLTTSSPILTNIRAVDSNVLEGEGTVDGKARIEKYQIDPESSTETNVNITTTKTFTGEDFGLTLRDFIIRS